MTATADLLLEIGVEELPARFGPLALEQLKTQIGAALASARLPYSSLGTYGTPRRLTLLVNSLALQQEDRDILAKGPARKAAYDAEGNPTRAAEGFARGQGISPTELFVQSDEKGVEYVYARRHETGQSAVEILPRLLRELIYSLDFPQSMRWGTHTMRFARPIRWIVCLLSEQVVPFEIEGIAAGRETRGLRTLAPHDMATIATAQDYLASCARVGVLADVQQRKETIWAQVQAVAHTLGGYIPPNDDLLEEITWIVEQPHAFHGSFDPSFLETPADVLVTSMREHQRYFPVYNSDKRTLLPNFIAVRNGGADYIVNVRHGNEKVLRARLSDARFFWDEDRKYRLEDRLESLKTVTFQEKLGSQAARTERIVALADRIGELLGYDEQVRAQIARTAELCKCDLVTHMVFEFPELQGVMGREYATVQGEESDVAIGIYEHYLPRGAGDELPTHPTGIAVGLADKLDTLAGFFGLGLIPTGSADPFALRRAAQGVTSVIVERGLHLNLFELLQEALAGYRRFDQATTERALGALRDFFQARLEGSMKEQGIRYDVVDAVLTAGFANMTDAMARAEALNASLSNPEFAAVTGAFKRVANIAAKAAAEAGGSATPTAIADVRMPDDSMPAEIALWQAFTELRLDAAEALNRHDYRGFYAIVARLRAPVDSFFDQVLVMDPDQEVRDRRLGMLRQVAALLTRPADLAKLAVG